MFRKFLTVRNCTLAVIVSIIVAACAYGYFRDRSPSPLIDVNIVGPNTARTGEMIALVVDGIEMDSYAWIVFPGNCQYRAVEDGRVLILMFHIPGEYTAVLGTSDGSKVELRKHVILAGSDPGPGPLPPPPEPEPEPEPGPEPEPEPYDGAWVKWTYEVALATVTSPNRALQAAALAEQFKSVSAQIASGNIGTTKEARVKLRVVCNLALGNDALNWAAFSKRFSEHCIELEATGGLESLAQYRKIYDSAAKGLTKVTFEKKKDSRVVSCVDGSCK